MGFLNRLNKWLADKNAELQRKQREADNEIAKARIETAKARSDIAALNALESEMKEAMEKYSAEFSRLCKEGKKEELKALNEVFGKKYDEFEERLKKFK